MLQIEDLQIDYSKNCESNLRNKMLSVKNVDDLAKLLNKTAIDLNYLATNPSNYKTFQLKKKKGGFREIDMPENTLKYLQKTLNLYFQSVYLPLKSEASHGFIFNPKKRFRSIQSKLQKRQIAIVESDTIICNIKTNAEKHCNQKYVLNIDLKDFFTSISVHQIFKLFRGPIFNFDENVSSVLALLVTYKKRLPQGAPTSPILSNLICINLDENIEKYCKVRNINFTRYADDLTFSSNELISKEIIDDIQWIIQSHQFEVQPKKLRLISQKGRQTVTGLVVNKKVNVSRAYYKKLRAILHDCEKNGIENAFIKHYKNQESPNLNNFIHKIEGMLHFIAHIKGYENRNVISMNLKFKALKGIN
jgi:RNA-directed DNA polymerase